MSNKESSTNIVNHLSDGGGERGSVRGEDNGKGSTLFLSNKMFQRKSIIPGPIRKTQRMRDVQHAL